MRKRQVVAGQAWVVRRYVRRDDHTFWGEPWIDGLFEYALGAGQGVSGVNLLGYAVMPNYFQVVLEDVEGRLPLFMQQVARLMTVAISREQGLWQWSPWRRRKADWTALNS